MRQTKLIEMKLPNLRPRIPTKDQVVARCTSIEAWQLPKQSSSIAPETVWSNADQDPVPKEQQTWGGWTFAMYWFSDLVTISTWQVGSSILIVGLSTTDAILIMLVAGICNMIPTVLNGAIGADHHIPFPVAIRASYGYWFSYFCVVSRAILAAFWFGVQSVGGGFAMSQAITCIWPSYANLPNHLPASAHITTGQMVSYLLFHLVQFPCMLIPMYKLKTLFWVKSILVPPMAIGMLIWICVKADNDNSILRQPTTLSGSQRAWAWLLACTSVTGGFSTLAVNISDFSRFSKSRYAHYWQIPTIPVLKIVTALFGIVATGAGRIVYGEDMWSPIQLIAKWEGSGGRFLGFVCSMLWILAQVSCNLSANSFSFANDVTTMLPKYINIKRGAILCTIIGGWALVPWLMVSSAVVFLQFMSGYAVFLGPMAGIMLADYWLVRRRKLDVPGLYDPHGRYRYKWGTNWRAAVVTVVIVTPLLPGLAHAISPAKVNVNSGIDNLYAISWLYGFHASIVLYYVLTLIWPVPATLVPKTLSGSPAESIEGVDVEGRIEISVSQEKGDKA